MNSYIVNFAVYSFAMIGFFITILFLYKKSVNSVGIQNQKEFLKVENTLKLSPVKTIYVIKAGNERFLIAGDTANTTMLSRLEYNEETQKGKEKQTKFPISNPLSYISRDVEHCIPAKIMEKLSGGK